jgi:hypothetical protein
MAPPIPEPITIASHFFSVASCLVKAVKVPKTNQIKRQKPFKNIVLSKPFFMT